ncbi:MAG: hypothetical protein PXY39_12645 [archaeon]|nr:hypothetical protein [archaeon]
MMNYSKLGMIAYGFIIIQTGIFEINAVAFSVFGHFLTMLVDYLPLMYVVGLILAGATWIFMWINEKKLIISLVAGILLIAQIPLTILLPILLISSTHLVSNAVFQHFLLDEGDTVQVLLAVAFFLVGRLYRTRYLSYAAIATVLSVIVPAVAPTASDPLDMLVAIFAFVGFISLDATLRSRESARIARACSNSATSAPL